MVQRNMERHTVVSRNEVLEIQTLKITVQLFLLFLAIFGVPQMTLKLYVLNVSIRVYDDVKPMAVMKNFELLLYVAVII